MGRRPGYEVMCPVWLREISEFAASLDQRGYAQGTRASYVRGIRMLAVGVDATPWAVTPSSLDAWAVGRGWTEKVPQYVTVALRAFYSWGIETDRVEKSPVNGPLWPSRREQSSDHERLSEAWVKALDAFEGELGGLSLSAQGVQRYLKHVQWCASGVNVADPWKVTGGDLNRWLSERSWSTSTRQSTLVSLRVFYSMGVRLGHIEWAPVADVLWPKRTTSGPRRFPIPEAWSEPLAAYLQSYVARGCTKQTLATKRDRISLLARNSVSPRLVTALELESFLANPDWSANTRRGVRNEVVLFFRWAESTRLVERSPAADISPVNTPRALPRPVPPEIVEEALAAADDRVRLMLLLAVDAGLRRAEIAGIHTRDLAEGALVVHGKGGHMRMVPLDPEGELSRALKRELRRRRDGGLYGNGWPGGEREFGWLFPTNGEGLTPMTPKHVGKLMERALPGEYTGHQLRHRFATSAYRATRDLRAVQELLGHSKPETTARYAAVPDGALLAAVRGAASR